MTAAISRVADHRGARLTSLDESLGDYATQSQRRWAIWLRKQHLTDQVPNEFSLVLAAIGEFADPALLGKATGLTWNAAHLSWVPTRRRPERVAADLGRPDVAGGA